MEYLKIIDSSVIICSIIPIAMTVLFLNLNLIRSAPKRPALNIRPLYNLIFFYIIILRFILI